MKDFKDLVFSPAADIQEPEGGAAGGTYRRHRVRGRRRRACPRLVAWVRDSPWGLFTTVRGAPANPPSWDQR
jgi:hypothetical protein